MEEDMRPKKDPGVRQEAFIRAATELFMEHGYEGVSIRDVLDAVADKTASPSVFYYYFKSKDALYRACVEAVAAEYISGLQEGFSMEGKSRADWAVSLVMYMESILLNEKKLIMTGRSTANRLFILDMREKVTKKIENMWAESFLKFFGMPALQARKTALFLGGGIGELITEFLVSEDHSKAAADELAGTVVAMAVSVIGLSPEEKEEILSALMTRKNDVQ